MVVFAVACRYTKTLKMRGKMISCKLWEFFKKKALFFESSVEVTKSWDQLSTRC